MQNKNLRLAMLYKMEPRGIFDTIKIDLKPL